MMIMWCMVLEIWSVTEFFILGHFSPFYPTNNLKNQNFEKIYIKSGDTIILHLCTTNDNHIIYRSWDMDHKRLFFVLLTPPPNNTENQNLEKMKKMPGDIIILLECTINENQMMYGSWDMKCDRIFCYFGPLFALLPH